MSLRHWWHNATHRHLHMDRPNIGLIVLCSGRLSGRVRAAHVSIGGRASWLLREPTDEQLRRLAEAPTSVELGLTAWEMEVAQP